MNNPNHTHIFSHMQQPQDNPGAQTQMQTSLETEMEKNRILRAALATKDSVTRKYMRRSCELSRLQASIDDTTKQLKTLMTELGGDANVFHRKRLSRCILALSADIGSE